MTRARPGRHAVATALAIVTVLIAAPAWARVTDLLADIRATSLQLGDAVAKKDELTAQNEQEQKAVRAMGDSRDALEKDLNARIDAFKAGLDAQVAHARKVVEDWDSRCSVKVVGELPKAQYDKCMGEQPYVNKVAEEANTARFAGAKRFTDEVIAPRMEILKRQEAGIAEINARIKQRFEAWSAYDKNAKALQARLEGLHGQLGRDCAAAAAPETVKACSAIGFDTASRTLPSLDGIRNRVDELCAQGRGDPDVCGVR